MTWQILFDSPWFVEMDLFDDFGNYIGPSEEIEPIKKEFPSHEESLQPDERSVADESNFPLETTQIILNEHKSYYPSALQIYGPDVQMVYQQEDTQPLDEPIIPVVTRKTVQLSERTGVPETLYDLDYMLNLFGMTDRIRNIAIIGSLHSGKSSLIDMFVSYSHALKNPSQYTDCLHLERKRKITLKSKSISFVLPNSKGKSHAATFVDTPGHTSFSDEVWAALPLVDGIVLVIDPVEGLTWHTEQLLREMLGRKMKIVLVLNKLDRLFLELKLPPNDAYLLLRHTVDSINMSIKTMGFDLRFEPENNNVVFGCFKHEWAFTCQSFGSFYPDEFADSYKRLWSKSLDVKNAKSNPFVQYVLEPIYKLYTSVLQLEGAKLAERLETVGIRLTKSHLKMDPRELLPIVLKLFFSNKSIECFVDAIGNYIDPPFNVNNSTELVFHASKIFGKEAEIATPHSTINSFFALGRVASGTLSKGQSVKLVGKESSPVGIVEEIFIYQSRYQIPIQSASQGTVVAVLLNSTLQSHLTKSFTLIDSDSSSTDLPSFSIPPVIVPTKLCLEPVVPAELPKMVDGLRKVSLLYPALEVRVEQSGEHLIAGTGELYLDCVMYDLRINYGELEVKVSQPMVKFCETVIETSEQKCTTTSPNHRNTLSVICGPITSELGRDIENGQLTNYITQTADPTSNRQLSKLLQSKYNWDLLEARNLWSLGPDSLLGPNVLIEDCIPSVTDKAAVASIKQSLILGFQWACREGPLCEEVVKNVKFRLIDATVSTEPAHKSGSQIIPACRRACYAAMLSASPRLLEPIAMVEIQTISECISSIYSLLTKRRGHVVREVARGGTPFFFLHALLPVIDSFGFETDLRIISQGQAFCHQSFSHWDVVPGDPLDSSLIIRPLEPSDSVHMARDFVLKSRKRKGLPLDISIEKFLE